MSLVDKDHMTELRPASDAKTTAQTALDEIQLKAVAYAINNASNCGELRVDFIEHLRPTVKSTLESNGYTLKDIGTAKLEDLTVISWS